MCTSRFPYKIPTTYLLECYVKRDITPNHYRSLGLDSIRVRSRRCELTRASTETTDIIGAGFFPTTAILRFSVVPFQCNIERLTSRRTFFCRFFVFLREQLASRSKTDGKFQVQGVAKTETAPKGNTEWYTPVT